MSKKIIVTISAALLIILLGLVGYYLIIKNNTDGTGGGITSGFRSFFPFGGNDLPPSETATTTENTPPPPEETIPNFTQKLRKISDEPVAGAGTLDVKAGTVVRYIEKATGHIFEVELFSPKQARISNTTIPVVYNAVWGNSNNSLVTQYLKDDNQTIDTYSLTIKNISTTTEVSLAGTAVAKNITDISSFGKEFFYLTEGTNSSLGYVGDFAGTKVKQIWNSNITQLNSQFINSKTVALTTKPARYVLGYMYTVDTTTGAKRKILGDVAGLSTLSDGLVEQIFYLENGAASRAFIFNSKTGVTSDITPTTFPEKCVWSKKSKNVMFCGVPRSSINPDSLTQWYQGLISTDDDIWKYNTKDNTTTIVGTLPESSEGGIDVTKPMLSENEQYLVFTNKKDNTLWSLDLLK